MLDSLILILAVILNPIADRKVACARSGVEAETELAGHDRPRDATEGGSPQLESDERKGTDESPP